MLVFTLILDSQKHCVHHFFLYRKLNGRMKLDLSNMGGFGLVMDLAVGGMSILEREIQTSIISFCVV